MNAFSLFLPSSTLPHGTIFRPVPNGFRLQRPDRSTLGSIAVRKRKDGTAWYAACDAWDGFTWTRDRFIQRPTIAELEAGIREYANQLDNHAHAIQIAGCSTHNPATTLPRPGAPTHAA